jgi:hypothetical protein
MRTYSKWVIGAMLVSYAGCSPRGDTYQGTNPPSVSGTWVLATAPPTAVKSLADKTNWVSLSLYTNGISAYTNLPVEVPPSFIGGFNTTSRWEIVSGTGSWEVGDWGQDGKNVWQVRLHTERLGVQLTISTHSSGLQLKYYPDPESNESITLIRKQQ